MKRRVMIGKALAHEPRILFLDEPTAGVDVELRKDMWNVVRKLKESGVTIILTTHYIEEAEEMADRIGIINKGELMLVEDKDVLMQKLGEKRLLLQLRSPLTLIPAALAHFKLQLQNQDSTLVYTYDAKNSESSDITHLLDAITAAGIQFKDLETKQNSLEEIFVNLVKK
jgi:ABC-2 type transport system ATP-binding protein